MATDVASMGTDQQADPRPAWHRRRSHPPRSTTSRRLRQDGLLAAGVVAAEMLLTSVGPPEMRLAAAWPTVITGSVLSAVPIGLRRVLTWPAALLAVVSLAVALVTGHQALSMAVAFLVLTYTTAGRFRLLAAVLAATLLWLPVVIAAMATPAADLMGIPRTYMIFANVLIALVCFFIGRTTHARRSSTRALEERARVAEENQRTVAERAVADERRRIARELHDVVAHHVSVMGVLATGARRILHRDPQVADEAMNSIAETSRTTLREMRRLLDVLRTDAEPAADLTPQPGLAGIETLVDQVREAGLPVSLRVDGVPGALDPGVALTIYRIVQEALTNAIKHAGHATAQVRLNFGVSWLIVEVFDTGRGPAPDAKQIGHGLVGMRERVALYGGTLRTGPRPGGGFRIHAKLPMAQLGASSDEETA